MTCSSGEQHYKARLTERLVSAIRADRERGAHLMALAAKYGVGYSTIRDVVHRRTWAHVA